MTGTRQQLVDRARSLVGWDPRLRHRPKVRFRHQGRTPSGGMDCAGMLIWACHQCGFYVDFDFTAYDHAPDGAQMAEILREKLGDPIDAAGAVPGDLVHLKEVDQRWPLHLAMLGDYLEDFEANGLSVIHSWSKVRGVVEARMPKEWSFKVKDYYSIPELRGVPWERSHV